MILSRFWRNQNEQIPENIFVCSLLSGVGPGRLQERRSVRPAYPGGDYLRYRNGGGRVLGTIRILKGE